MNRKLVILESPYAGPTPEAIAANVAYARRCLRHSLDLGEAPIASHLLYTQVLDDSDPVERRLGLDAALTWLEVVDRMVIYTDLGISLGMKEAIMVAESIGLQRVWRSLPIIGDDEGHSFQCP